MDILMLKLYLISEIYSVLLKDARYWKNVVSDFYTKKMVLCVFKLSRFSNSQTDEGLLRGISLHISGSSDPLLSCVSVEVETIDLDKTNQRCASHVNCISRLLCVGSFLIYILS